MVSYAPKKVKPPKPPMTAKPAAAKEGLPWTKPMGAMPASKPAVAAPILRSANETYPMAQGSNSDMAQVYANQQGDLEARYAALVENNPNDPRSSKYGASGSGTDPNMAANNAIATLFHQYNQPEDNSLMQQLLGYSNQAQATGSGAINDLQSLLAAQQNPYAHQMAAPSVGVNPMAEYMNATGASTNQVDALRNMLQGQNNDRASAANTMMGQLGQSWQNSQQGRQADAATSGAAFKQQLGDQQAGMQSQLQAQQKKQKDALMQKILEMAISNGVDLGSLGVKF